MAETTNDGAISDPKLYAKLSVPFATTEEADAAMAAFHTALRKLRAKHRIADVIAVTCVHVGDEGKPVITLSQNGDFNREAPMLAWALGRAQRRQQDVLASMIASAQKAR